MKLGAIAAKVCENLGSRALSLEREWLSPSGWPFLFCRREGQDALRSSIVRFLKDKAWLGHELRRAEQAFPIFARFFFMTLWSSTGARRLPKPSF